MKAIIALIISILVFIVVLSPMFDDTMKAEMCAILYGLYFVYDAIRELTKLLKSN